MKRWFTRLSLMMLLVGCATPSGATQVSQLQAWHREGQTFLTWREVDSPVGNKVVSVQNLQELRDRSEKEKRVRYRIYRSQRPITTINELKPVAEVPPFTCWNTEFYGIHPKPEHQAFRYVVEESKDPVPSETGIYVHTPLEGGVAYYAVSLVVDGKENTTMTKDNTLPEPVREAVGSGLPVLQRVEKPSTFQRIKNPTLYYYVRWESPPNSNVPGKPFDYVVAIPPQLAKPAPVGIHLHAWGGSLNGGYGWWFNAEHGAILISSNQIPYDWWTGYHEYFQAGQPLQTKADWAKVEAGWTKGIVRPYSQRRMLSFLDWVATKWDVDLSRTFVAGNSMGGSGALMLALRFSERIAWAVSWVGIHVPSMSPQFKNSYARVYGDPEWGVKFEDGTPVWDYFNDAWYLRKYPQKEIGFLTFSNGKNDKGIGWPQAVEFYRALQETRRPHLFVWGQAGHGQRALMPFLRQGPGKDSRMPLDIRTNQSLPAFTYCSLDDDPGNGDLADGAPNGQSNAYLYWETNDIIDQEKRWEMTVGLIEQAPRDPAQVHITPRRCQMFHPHSGEQLSWTNTAIDTGKIIQSGQVKADQWGIVTLEKVLVAKGKNRIIITK
jgi:S-formylglutathione hydrolase FrmB